LRGKNTWLTWLGKNICFPVLFILPNWWIFSLVLNIYPIRHINRGYLFVLVLIRWGLHPGNFSVFSLRRSHIDWPITNIFGTLCTAQYRSLDIVPPQNRSLVLLPSGSPFTTYVHGCWTMAKQCRINKNRGVIGKVLGNTLGTWGTFWEPDGTTLGTCWEETKNKRSTSPMNLGKKN
jgi:hypothetical protein